MISLGERGRMNSSQSSLWMQWGKQRKKDGKEIGTHAVVAFYGVFRRTFVDNRLCDNRKCGQ